MNHHRSAYKSSSIIIDRHHLPSGSPRLAPHSALWLSQLKLKATSRSQAQWQPTMVSDSQTFVDYGWITTVDDGWWLLIIDNRSIHWWLMSWSRLVNAFSVMKTSQKPWFNKVAEVLPAGVTQGLRCLKASNSQWSRWIGLGWFGGSNSLPGLSPLQLLLTVFLKLQRSHRAILKICLDTSPGQGWQSHAPKGGWVHHGSPRVHPSNISFVWMIQRFWTKRLANCCMLGSTDCAVREKVGCSKECGLWARLPNWRIWWRTVSKTKQLTMLSTMINRKFIVKSVQTTYGKNKFHGIGTSTGTPLDASHPWWHPISGFIMGFWVDFARPWWRQQLLNAIASWAMLVGNVTMCLLITHFNGYD